MGALLKRDARRAIWNIYDRSIRDGDCLLWQGAATPKGYGRIWIGDRVCAVHRVVWTATHGAIPRGKIICHRCDTPRCVNVDHLFIGTQADNLLDMRNKGRGAPPPTPITGEAHHAASLTDKQVAKIRAMGRSVSQREIARKFKCRQSTVWRILHNLTRKEARNA